MRFTITRKKWLRGEGGNKSALLRTSDGKRCCMGHVATQCGVPDARLRDVGYLDSVPAHRHQTDPNDPTAKSLRDFIQSVGDRAYWASRKWVQTGYTLNDATDLTEGERESKLSALFAQNGHELVFTD